MNDDLDDPSTNAESPQPMGEARSAEPEVGDVRRAAGGGEGREAAAAGSRRHWRPKGRELVPDSWRAFDETLADEAPDGDAPVESRSWIADQRVMHGLLRALHGQDAAAREATIDTILERIDAPSAGLRRWLPLLAAAVVLACFGLWAVLPDRLPTADAAVQRAVAELARDVARRFRVETSVADAAGKQVMHHEVALLASPGSRFRLSGKFGFGALQLGEVQVGCDGTEIWGMSANGVFRRAMPFAERDRLLAMFGDTIDLGYLDVQALVQKLPADFELKCVGRESDASGRSLLRIEASRRHTDARVQLRDAWLLCDEATGMVTRLEVEVAFPRGTRRTSMEYLGEEPPGLVQFGRPW
ncbi:MAG: hypothetical protein JNK15_09625 [Planctomycetes bacterium]|nr:hypothetical protein [Planctomycetota bacterium]